MTDIDKLRELSVAERIQLVEDLWDSIAADSANVKLSVLQTEELDRRIKRLDESPAEWIEWSNLKDRILKSI